MSRIIDCSIDEHVLSMYYHRFFYTLLNRRVHGIIDDRKGPVGLTGVEEAQPSEEEANQIPPGGLIEWT